jgi:hypothetical protein
MQSWRSRSLQGVSPELADFIATPLGAEFLQRIVMSAYQAIHFGCGGIRGLQEFLRLSRLDQFVGSSYGALQAFSLRCEEHIVVFGESEEQSLSAKMKRKKITAALDEMFRGRCPCLVAIEVVSDFILLEKFTKDRTAETWSKELQPRLGGLNLELGQVVSDLCGGLRACANEFGAQHIPELFHAQHELTKATAAPLAAQEREFENAVCEAENSLKKAVDKHGQDSERAKSATMLCKCRKVGLEMRRERRQKVKAAKKELGKIHHPINLKSGKIQTAEIVKDRFESQLKIIEACAKEAELSQSCGKRLAKARRAFDAIVNYVTYFFLVYAAFVKEMGFREDEELFFNEVIFPLSYLKMIWKRIPKREREELSPLRTCLEGKLRDAAYTDVLKFQWLQRGQECAEMFQRSSSCVEGRNGLLSLYYHRFHRLGARSLKALTIVHNFHTKRSDNTTAAERFFGHKHKNLFESLVVSVRIPGRPRQTRAAKQEQLAA